MLPRNHVFNSTRFPSLTSLQNEEQEQYKQPQLQKYSSLSTLLYTSSSIEKKSSKRRNTTKSTALINSTIATTSIYSSNSSAPLSLTSSTQQQQHLSFEDPYSPKTGIKTAALLGGMLVLVIFYLIWKARARLCRPKRSASGSISHTRASATKFDLDYWLKQVDLLEAKEAERNRGGQSLYLELPNQPPRDNRQATATWIADAYRHWRLLEYRRQQQLFHDSTNEHKDNSNPVQPYRRRRNLMRRIFRRYFTSSSSSSRRRRPSFLTEHSTALLTGMRPSIVSNQFIPPAAISAIPIRRTNSWPRLKSSNYQTGAPSSALQTHLARKRLLKRTSRTTFDI